ncbi:MAG: hypothetical protein OXU36_08745 [Candidatus Poribacteria bacterium]|nr:hypothetical protein [Candidatus Poribacteria bacterium]
MHTLWLIIQREFVSNVLTSRFMIGFVVCVLSTTVAVFVQVDDYEKRLSGYNTAIRRHRKKHGSGSCMSISSRKRTASQTLSEYLT